MLGVMLGVCLGLGGGRRWEQPGAARSSPGAAESSPEQPGELWNSSGRAQGNPGHLENDTFGSEPWGANFRFKPRSLKSEALQIHQIALLTRKKYQIDLWSSCVALAGYSK